MTESTNDRRCALLVLSALCPLASGGCASNEVASPTVARAWQHRVNTEEADTTAYGPSEPVRRPAWSHPRATPDESTVATVNGEPIARDRVVALLIQSRGASVLEQLIGFELAKGAAANRGLSVTQAEVDREYKQTLRRLADSPDVIPPDAFDRPEAERLLDAVLKQRQSSREEFELFVRRNAYLRKLVGPPPTFTEQQVREEYDRVYGKRVRIRHIQLASLAGVERIKERLAAGEDFKELASGYSANRDSARTGGLLDPFSQGHQEVPAVLRKVAFAMKPGETSDAVRVGRWYHLVKLEETLAAEKRDFDAVEAGLTEALRRRAADEAMSALYEKLVRAATIEIHDAALKKAFNDAFPGRVR